MSLIITIKTNSHNGLPIRTLQKEMEKHNMELVENIEWERVKNNKSVYSVTLHESVNPETELNGK